MFLSCKKLEQQQKALLINQEAHLFLGFAVNLGNLNLNLLLPVITVPTGHLHFIESKGLKIPFKNIFRYLLKGGLNINNKRDVFECLRWAAVHQDKTQPAVSCRMWVNQEIKVWWCGALQPSLIPHSACLVSPLASRLQGSSANMRM